MGNSEGKSLLAVCVPTYGRPEYIKELLDEMMTIYSKYGIDLYLCDSSEDDDTQKVVNLYLNNYSNLYYNRVDSGIHSNKKAYQILQGKYLRKKYQYLWLCGDAVRQSENLICEVLDSLDNNYDMIVINNNDVEMLGNRTFYDYNEVFEQCAWWLTFYGAAIINYERMSLKADWDYLEQKYCNTVCINYSHVAFYFETFLKLESLRVLYKGVSAQQFKISELKKHAGWYKETYRIIFESWISTIKSLPDKYENREKAIYKLIDFSGSFSFEYFILLREEGAFNLRTFFKYYRYWRYCAIPRSLLFRLSCSAPDNSRSVLYKDIKRFCKKYSHIYIYGCGQISDKYTKILKKIGIEFDGYIVSHTEKNGEKHNGYTVEQVSDKHINDNGIGIILALGKKNCWAVMKNENLQKISDRIYTEYKWNKTLTS